MLHCSTCDSVSKFLTALTLYSLTGKGKVNGCTQPFLVNSVQQDYCVDFSSTNLLVLLLSFYLIFLKNLFFTFEFDIQRTAHRDIFL